MTPRHPRRRWMSGQWQQVWWDCPVIREGKGQFGAPLLLCHPRPVCSPCYHVSSHCVPRVPRVRPERQPSPRTWCPPQKGHQLLKKPGTDSGGKWASRRESSPPMCVRPPGRRGRSLRPLAVARSHPRERLSCQPSSQGW